MSLLLSLELKQIVSALVKAQSELKNPTFDSTNPFFKQKYASLAGVRDTIMPVLTKHGIAVIQNLQNVEHGISCETVLLHESGEYITFGPLIMPAVKADAQGLGSAATYARRYALMACVSVVGDSDDDGNEASKYKKQDKPKEPDKPSLLTRDQLIEKLKSSQNIHELKARWLKYDPDFKSLSATEQDYVRSIKDLTKIDLDESAKNDARKE
jgi:hypothetical protein